ncbi:MAG: glycine--tRNA ligase subunit beta [Bryobacteraceae bacterium]|jgi:glycyl-tRNA synthetase beta chain
MTVASLAFLLEIGTEEIPDWMIPAALESLRLLFEKTAIPHETIRVDATPRRLVLRAEGIPTGQLIVRTRRSGPATSAPAQNVEGFARKQGVRTDDLEIERTAKGEYYVAVKEENRGFYKEILADLLPGIILQINFPKTMYWTGKGGPRFIRPIRWIVALLGDEVIPFELAGVRAGTVTSGHRRLGAREIAVTTADYEQRLRENYVILSAEERRHKIHDGMAGVRVKRDDALVETLAYLTEHPTPIVGSFDAEFLELPEEVLVTVMRHHQKYFSVEDEHGKLAPQFVAVMNIPSDPEGFVRRGNERVLRARFNDARFFWETDQKKSLAARVADLAHVTFQAKLGTYLEKTERVKALVGALGGDAHAVRAAELAKCDLTTELVKEFTELQGVVGGLYARAQGEADAVWQAIYDHYKPESMEDAIPRNRTGQIVALADKLDTLRGCFGVGLIPTGSRDPFALRRAAQGVVKILVEGKVDLDLAPLVNDPTDGAKALTEFLQDRIRYYFKDVRGFQYDEVNAAMAAGWSNLVDLEARLIRIRNLRSSPDFEPLAASFKRIRNILDQQKFTGTSAAAIDEKLLQDGPERDLYDEYRSIAGQPIESVISQLRPKVDLFFDKVLVNAPEDDVRRNRLMLLGTLLLEFSNIADFSEIVTTS